MLHSVIVLNHSALGRCNLPLCTQSFHLLPVYSVIVLTHSAYSLCTHCLYSATLHSVFVLSHSARSQPLCHLVMCTHSRVHIALIHLALTDCAVSCCSQTLPSKSLHSMLQSSIQSIYKYIMQNNTVRYSHPAHNCMTWYPVTAGLHGAKPYCAHTRPFKLHSPGLSTHPHASAPSRPRCLQTLGEPGPAC